MPKTIEKILLFTSDFLTIHLTFFLWAWLRRKTGHFAETETLQLFINSAFVFLFWFLLFLFYGLYRSWYAQSRVDEFVSIFKTVSVGVLVIFILTMEPQRDVEEPLSAGRMLILSYWGMMIATVSTGRLALRTFQRKLLEAGIGARKTLIVGWSDRARELYDQVQQSRALGYRVVGFIDTHQPARPESYKSCPVVGSLREIGEVVAREDVEEILIALEGQFRERVSEVLAQCNGRAVNFKIVPDLYDILTGQVRTSQIYGFPLIEVMPELMLPWEQRVKRLLDIVVSLLVLVTFLPLWIIIGLAIRIDSRGPVFYKQRRVGKNGKLFTMYKFRSMVVGAEAMTGPKWAEKNDPRVTRVGRIIRQLHFDEVPQFMNVLRGDMSLIGPRPERPYFVEKLKAEIPLYARRLKIQPGITGWAQVKGDYDASLEDVKRKLQYDFFYIENMSLRTDFKILLNTLYVMLRGKGQ